MIRPQDFRLLSVQAAAFTPKTDDFKSARIIANLVPLTLTRYNGQIISSAPPKHIEIDVGGIRIAEKVTLTSEDDRWKVEVVLRRSDSYWNSQGADDGQEGLAKTCRLCLEPLQSYPIADDIQIGRLALIVRRWIPLDDPATALTAQFCKSELVDEKSGTAPFRHSHDFQLHNRKRYESGVKGVFINSWVRCRSDVRIHDQPAITVEQDLNTLSEELESRAFHRNQIEEYFGWAVEEADRILDLYFPGSG